VDVHAKLAELRQAVEGARSMPMSASAVVNRAELLAMVDEIAEAVDKAFSDSQRVLADRDEVLRQAQREAEQIVADAHSEREHLISDTDIFRLAKREGEQVLEKARAEAEALRAETDEYVDAKLANFEITLEKVTEAVKRGRERLAGRTALHSLTDEEVDKIVLPEHLEG
jgi:cell division septum initiation protein DivIVA